MKRFLIIDDDIGDQIITEMALRMLGISCERSADQDEAVNKLRTNEYEAVLVDFHMTPKDGAQMIDIMKSIKPRIPMYILTGYQREFIEKKIQCQHDGILSKDGLIENLRAAFNGA